MSNVRLDEAQAGIKIARRNIKTSDMKMTPPLWQKVKKNLKSLLMKVKGEWKIWLETQHSENKDHGIQFHHFMANRWGNNGNSGRLYFLGLQNHCKDISLLTKVHLIKSMVFLVVMYGCESWTIKKVSTKELMLLNCGVGEDSWEPLGLQDQNSQS